MAFRSLPPLSAWSPSGATLPHVFEKAGYPPVPNPILESGHKSQPTSLLAIIPILALEQYVKSGSGVTTLKPSMLQLGCKDASEPMNDFHVPRPSDVARYCPSAMSENKESAVLFMSIKCFSFCSWIFIPRQILEKELFQ